MLLKYVSYIEMRTQEGGELLYTFTIEYLNVEDNYVFKMLVNKTVGYFKKLFQINECFTSKLPFSHAFNFPVFPITYSVVKCHELLKQAAEIAIFLSF